MLNAWIPCAADDKLVIPKTKMNHGLMQAHGALVSQSRAGNHDRFTNTITVANTLNAPINLPKIAVDLRQLPAFEPRSK